MEDVIQTTFDAVKNGIAQGIPKRQLNEYKTALIAALLSARRQQQTPELRNLVNSVMEKMKEEKW